MSWYIDDADNLVTHDHDPEAIRYYGIDVHRTLATADSVASAKAYIAGTEVSPVVVNGTIVAYRVSPSTPTLAAGSKLGITFEWTTALGDKDQRTVYLNVKDR
jgi:hypothetical protein